MIKYATINYMNREKPISIGLCTQIMIDTIGQDCLLDFLNEHDLARNVTSQKQRFERLKKNESYQYKIEWNANRILSKVNYVVHTDAIKNFIVPTLTEEQKSRLDFKNPCESYEEGGYQICNGFIAINSGGLFGVGIGNSKQVSYLPESHTDFIFPIIIEETGIVGGAFLLFLYFFFYPL